MPEIHNLVHKRIIEAKPMFINTTNPTEQYFCKRIAEYAQTIGFSMQSVVANQYEFIPMEHDNESNNAIMLSPEELLCREQQTLRWIESREKDFNMGIKQWNEIQSVTSRLIDGAPVVAADSLYSDEIKTFLRQRGIPVIVHESCEPQLISLDIS